MNMEGKVSITLTAEEAEILYNHLNTSILEEVRNDAEDYDNMHYLVTLCNIYQRCSDIVMDQKKAEEEQTDV